MKFHAPHGYEEIVNVYGDLARWIDRHGELSPAWEREKLQYLHLPFSMQLAWAPHLRVDRIRCHRVIVPVLAEIFDTIHHHHLEDEVEFFGGCFQFRPKRLGNKFSLHSWGVAIDFNPQTNQMGTKGNMSLNIVTIFKEFGATWGGDWSGKNKDPMHFQFASGY